MGTILQKEKAPFLLTILISLVAWGITHIASKSLNSPLLEYSRKAAQGTEAYFVDCEGELKLMTPPFQVDFLVRNISRKQKLDWITIQTKPPAGSTASVLGVRAHWHAPALGGLTIENCEPDYAKFESIPLQPQGQVTLSIAFSEAVEPSLYAERKNGAIVLKEANLETTIIRSETAILLVLVGISSTLIVAYLLFLGSEETQTTASDTEANRDELASQTIGDEGPGLSNDKRTPDRRNDERSSDRRKEEGDAGLSRKPS